MEIAFSKLLLKKFAQFGAKSRIFGKLAIEVAVAEDIAIEFVFATFLI